MDAHIKDERAGIIPTMIAKLWEARLWQARGLLNRQVRRSLAPENPADIDDGSL
jgi:hypothetical protein